MIDFNFNLDIKNSNYYDVKCDINSLDDHLVKLKDKPNFSLLTVNICSIRKNLNLLLLFLSNIDFCFDFIILNEIWLSPELGYQSEKLYRNQHDGGVTIYSLTQYSIKIIDKLTMLHCCFESLFINVTVAKNYTLCLGSIYRPPSSNLIIFNEHFRDSILSKIHHDKTIITGDFNVHLLKEHKSLAENNFINLFSEHNFSQIITHATRVTDTTESLIDHCWVTIPCSILSSTIEYKITDHFPICAIFPLYTEPIVRDISFRSFSDQSVDGFINNFNDVFNYYTCKELTNPNDELVDFIRIFEELTIEYFPIKCKTIKYSKTKTPWITKAILKYIKKKHRMYKKHRAGLITFSHFKIFRNLLSKAIRLSKRNYYFHKINSCNGNMKNIWHIINSLRKPFTSCNDFTIKVNNEILTKDEIIVNKFNDYFIQLPKDLKETIPKVINNSITKISMNEKSFWLRPTNENEIRNLINELDDKNFHTSPTPPRLIKLVADQMVIILCILFNYCFANVCFPDILKIAKVLPLPKINSRNVIDIKDYRPISILSPFTKLFEKIIYMRLYSFFHDCQLFSSSQFGFIKRKGIEDATINLLYDINEAINNKIYTVAVFLDFSKAFDLVNHSILINKLERYGVRGEALQFFKSYFVNRSQYVSINGTNSIAKDITSGVPQGSSLGPLYFLIYSNDIVNAIIKSNNILYADDTTIYFSGDSIEDIQKVINEELQNIYLWTCENELVLNSLKTKCMLFTTQPHPPLNITINGNSIEKVSVIKYLGLWIQDNLKFNKHITELNSTISKSNGLIYSLKQIFPLKILLSLYYSFVYSHINMHILSWGGTPSTVIKKIKVAQNNVIRNLSLNIEGVRTFELYKNLDILTVEQLYTLRCAEFVFRASNGNNRLKVDFLNENAWHHNHDTRRSQNYRIPFCRINTNKSFFLINALKIWDSLPNDLRNLKSRYTFKIKMKNLLIHNADNNIVIP
jgi:hypothetical protein